MSPRTKSSFDRPLLLVTIGVAFWPSFAILCFAAADWLRYGGV